MLKTKYRKGYAGLCADIKRRASDYAAKVALDGIRIHKDYLEEAVLIINGTIESSGILKLLSKAAFSHQDIEEFDSLAGNLHEKILAGHAVDERRCIRIFQAFLCNVQRQVPFIKRLQASKDFLMQVPCKGIEFLYVLMAEGRL